MTCVCFFPKVLEGTHFGTRRVSALTRDTDTPNKKGWTLRDRIMETLNHHTLN